jgi:hypothetical protein
MSMKKSKAKKVMWVAVSLIVTFTMVVMSFAYSFGGGF